MNDVGMFWAGYGIGMVTCFLSIWLMFRALRDQESYTNYWYEDSRKWMDAYFEATRDKESA